MILWLVTVPLAVTVLIGYGARHKREAEGLLPRHVMVVALAYLLLATVAAWGPWRRPWEAPMTLAGLGLGVVALTIVARREWSR